MACIIPGWRRFARRMKRIQRRTLRRVIKAQEKRKSLTQRTLRRRVRREGLSQQIWRLLDADHFDQAQHFLVRHVVERALVFLFEAFAEKFRGDKTSFPVGKVAAALFTKFNEGGIRPAYNPTDSVHIELGVDGIAVARGDGVPDVRKTPVVHLPP